MWVQAVGIGWSSLAGGFAGFAIGAALLGVGTAMVYPTLLAAIGDVAHPSWRASSVGVYRLWRDLGYAFGALLAGVTADALGLPAALMWVLVALRSPARRLRRALGARGVVVDVRSPDEFAQGHVDGAINIPLDTLAHDVSAEPPKAPMSSPCAARAAVAPSSAAEQLRASGFHRLGPSAAGPKPGCASTARGT
jgi:rhodanese-related sulfurtransferase